jgi:hypothetical protein
VTSLYVFDACGDGATGVIFRKALAAKMKQCAFPDEALKRYRERTRLILENQHDRMDKIIEEYGGLPDKIEGMGVTCREHQSAPGYVQLREKLEAYAKGQMKPDEILPGACDAEAFTP